MKTIVLIIFSLMCCYNSVYSQKLYTWGDNTSGRLGDGTTEAKVQPNQIGSDSNWVRIAVSDSKTLSIRADGSLWAWGDNSDGLFGDATKTSSNVPKRIGLENNWYDISISNNHVIALKKDGTLWAWGGNKHGSLGKGNVSDYNFPTQVGTDNNWKAISVGIFHTLALKKDGSLWAWGYNMNGELGLGYFNNSELSPKQIGTSRDWVYIYAGTSHNIAIKSNGTIWTWGKSTYGSLGLGFVSNTNVPTQIGTETNWEYAACSDNITLAIKTDGSLWAWGSNNNGKLGDGTVVDREFPVRIGNEFTWKAVFPGSTRSYGIKTNGTLWGWGLNDVNQLGIPLAPLQVLVPALIDSRTRWHTVASSIYHAAALFGVVETPIIESTIPTFAHLICNNYDKKIFKIYNTGKKDLIISNIELTGSNVSDFKLKPIALPKTIIPKDTAYLEVEFIPQSAGNKTAALRITANIEPNTISYNFSGLKDSISISTTADFYDLGIVCTGQKKDSTFTLKNFGNLTSSVFLSKTANLNFSETNISLVPTQIMPIFFSFNAMSSEGIYRDTLTIQNPTCNTKETIIFQIKVLNAKFTSENSTVETKVGIPKNMVVKLINQSPREIIILNSPTINPPFSLVGVTFPLHIPASTTVPITVRFSPTSMGTFSQTVRFDGFPCNAYTLCMLNGKATDTEILSSNPSIDNIICENSKDFEVKLENISDKKWTINDINLSGSDASQFIVLESFPFDIAENSEKLVRMQFKPNSIGTKSVAIKFSSNAPNASQITANLSARKDSASISIEESLIDLGTIIVETTKDSSINITNYGNLSNKALISGFNKFEFYQAQANLSASESSKIDFHFAGSDVPTTIEELVEVQDTICGRKHIVRIRVKVRAKDAEPEPDKEPKISASSSISFDDLVCESSSESKLRINSIGDTLLTINSIELNGANSGDFRVEPLAYPFDIDTATYREIKIYFEPTSPGIKTAQLVIKSSAVNDSIITLPLSASKDSMSFELAQRGIDLGSIEINNTKDSTIKVTNTSTRRANFTLNATANITLSSTTFSLEPSESRTIDFTFNGLPTVEEIREQITVLETTCGDSAKVFVSGSTYEVIIELPAECAIKVHQDSAKSGERINIKISIEDKKYFTYYKIDTIRVELVYNSTVLAPIGYPYYDINDTLAYINVPLYKNDIDNGKLVLFDVGLGNTEISNLTLRNPKFDVQDDDILYQLSSSNFTLLGLCKEGGTRLTQRTGKGGIINISPNPANAVSSITYAPIELGQTKIELFNVFGEKVASIMDKNISKLDNLEIIFDTREISSGTYFIRYSSATTSGSEMLIIKR